MSETNGHYLIPKWFVAAASAAIMVAVPWAVYVTVELRVLSSRVGDHPSLNAAHIAAMQGEIRDHERRLERLENE